MNNSNDCNYLGDCSSQPGCKPGYKGTLCDACESPLIENFDNFGGVSCTGNIRIKPLQIFISLVCTGIPCIVPSTVPEKYRCNAKQYYARRTHAL